MAFSPYGLGGGYTGYPSPTVNAPNQMNTYQNYSQYGRFQNVNEMNMNRYNSAGNDTLIQVNGLEGAQYYQVPPNSRIVLFDSNSDVMYIKTTDAGGLPTVKAYQFAEIAPENNGQSQYVTRSEYNDLLKQVEEMKGALNNGKLTISEQTANATTESAGQ